MNVTRALFRSSQHLPVVQARNLASPLALFSTNVPVQVCFPSNSRCLTTHVNTSIKPLSVLSTVRLPLSLGSVRNYASAAETKPLEDPADEGQDGEAPKESRGVEEYDPKDRTKLISWEVSARYLKSDAYKATYGTDPVWKSYRRQHKGQIPKPYTRRTCIKNGRIATGSPCPGCRDEYLVFDYRNTELLKQFLSPFTGERLNLHVIGLCARKRNRLDLELEKAKYFGTMAFKVPFRHYDYTDYYGKPVEVAEAPEVPEVADETETKREERQ